MEMDQQQQQPICRLCLKRDPPEMEDMLMISNLKMIEKIYECTTILIQETDNNLPTTLCSECLISIKNMYDFRQKSIKNQTYFLSIKIDPDDTKRTNVIHLPEPELDDKNDRKGETSQPVEIKPKRQLKKGVYKNPIPGLIACETCGIIIKRCRMEGHRNAHAGIRPYLCEVENCDKSYYDQVRLNNHKLDHHTGITHECDVCGKRFSILSSLRAHKRVHDTPQYIHCTFCGKQFRQKTSLRDHLRTHTGERPFECGECGKAFTHNSKLTVHKRSHTGEKPYKCDNCTESYGYGYMLKKHNEKCHRKIEND